MRRIAVIVCTLLLLAASASAEIRSIDITIFGMD
jgi:hypothetical protein